MADLRPKWKLEATIRAGHQIVALLNSHGERLSGVLASDTRETLEADLDALRAAELGHSLARNTVVVATLDQNEALATGALEVSAWRKAIRLAHPRNKALHASFGVGTPFSTKSVRSVASAMKVAIEAACKHPKAAREAAITPSSIEKMRASFEAVLKIDMDQEMKKSAARSSHLDRVQTQLRVERAIDHIVGVAIVTFVGQPLAETFTSVLPRKARGRKNAAEPEPETEQI
jgi:hypothetical protein